MPRKTKTPPVQNELLPLSFLGLKEHNGRMVVSSRDVARVFDKRHDHVLRDIRNLIEKDPVWGGLPNFEETPYVDPQNGQTYREYLINRDGFTMLAMGFTGDAAFQFKKAYISRFNQMEHVLLEKQTAEWQQTRLQSKRTRLGETDCIKKLIEYAREQGRQHAHKL